MKAARRQDVVEPGREHVHYLPWGSLMSAYAQQRVVLWAMAVGLSLSVIGNCLLALCYMRRETWVFVKDGLGNVVQADPDSFLRGNAKREDNEIKGFVLRFVRDAYEFTPLDVRDKAQYAFRFVDPKVQGAVSNGLRIQERARQIEQGLSVKIDEDIEKGRLVELSITRRDPLEVLAVFSRLAVSSTGSVSPMPPIAVRVTLRLVPRSPHNPNGLVVTDLTTTNS